MGDETREIERQLVERKEIYRQILDAIADMVLVKGEGSHILLVLSGYSVLPIMANHRELDLTVTLQKPFTDEALAAALDE